MRSEYYSMENKVFKVIIVLLLEKLNVNIYKVTGLLKDI